MQISNKIVTSTIILIFFLCSVGGEESKNLTTLVDDYDASLNTLKNLTDTNSTLQKEIVELGYKINNTENETENLEAEINDTKGNINLTNERINNFTLKTEEVEGFSKNPILTTALVGIPAVIIGLSLATLIGFILLVNRWKR